MVKNKLHIRIASLFELQKQGKELSLDQEFLIAAVLDNQQKKFAEISEKAYALGDGFTFKMLSYVWDYMRNSLGKGYETAFSIRVEDMIIDIAITLNGSTTIQYQDREYDLSGPYKRMTLAWSNALRIPNSPGPQLTHSEQFWDSDKEFNEPRIRNLTGPG